MLKVKIRCSNLIGEVNNAVQVISYSDTAIVDKVHKNLMDDSATVVFRVHSNGLDAILTKIEQAMFSKVDIIYKHRTRRRFMKK